MGIQHKDGLCAFSACFAAAELVKHSLHLPTSWLYTIVGEHGSKVAWCGADVDPTLACVCDPSWGLGIALLTRPSSVTVC